MRYELAQQFAEYKLSKEIEVIKDRIGSLNFVKMISFADSVKLTNEDIDYFMNMRPQRQEDESYEDMRIRGKFSKLLLKYRPYLYNYSVYNN